MNKYRAFTILELMVVVVILVLLMVMLLPAFHDLANKGENIVCKSNMRQLVIGYFQYAADNLRKIMMGIPQNNDQAFVRTGAGYNPIKTGALYPYVMTVDPYQCPSDPNGLERSYTAVAPLRGESWDRSWGGKTNQMGTGRLGGVFSANSQIVFTEESDRRGWNVGSFMLYVQDSEFYHWIDYVGLFHDNNSADNYAFLDGHVEIRHWATKEVIDMATSKRNFVWTRDNEDWEWLRPRYRNMPTKGSGNSMTSYYPPHVPLMGN